MASDKNLRYVNFARLTGMTYEERFEADKNSHGSWIACNYVEWVQARKVDFSKVCGPNEMFMGHITDHEAFDRYLDGLEYVQ